MGPQVSTSRSDTSPSAAAAQRAVFERMGPEGRLQAAIEMSEEMRAGLEAGIRARHPDFGEDAVRHELLRLLYGERLANAVRRRIESR
jgi:hypothetical protein